MSTAWTNWRKILHEEHFGELTVKLHLCLERFWSFSWHKYRQYMHHLLMWANREIPSASGWLCRQYKKPTLCHNVEVFWSKWTWIKMLKMLNNSIFSPRLLFCHIYKQDRHKDYLKNGTVLISIFYYNFTYSSTVSNVKCREVLWVWFWWVLLHTNRV